MKKKEFAQGEYYHIYNRGTDKRKIFTAYKDYQKFLKSIEDFNTYDPNWKKEAGDFRGEASEKPLVVVIAYCLNPNHYHLILREEKERGISEFMQRVGTGYTMYFNKKNERSGVLFQGPFKSIHIKSNEYLLYLSAYINHNHFIHGYSEERSEIYKFSSLPDFLEQRKQKWVNPSIIISDFKGGNDYLKFSKNKALYMKENKETEKLLLE